jgi:NADPH-dependent 2,4-dienoyl-CoA reductase/sulfur reductase-like enzyme
MQSIYRKGRLECLVNPALGREQEMQIVPATQPKKVMVVGAGPGGLNAAWVAAKRGHEVHLYEKQSYLGGQLVPGSKTAYKREMQSLINFQKRQVELNGVICHMGQEVTAQSVQEENPDVVILATGSRPILPTIEGIDEASVVTFDVVLDGDVQENKTTVIIGGGSTGCEVAYHLSEMGSAVTIVELMPKMGRHRGRNQETSGSEAQREQRPDSHRAPAAASGKKQPGGCRTGRQRESHRGPAGGRCHRYPTGRHHSPADQVPRLRNPCHRRLSRAAHGQISHLRGCQTRPVDMN